MEESSDIDTSSSPNLDSDCTLSKDEENVIRYASGYVPMSLMKKYEKHLSDVSVPYVECLSI